MRIRLFLATFFFLLGACKQKQSPKSAQEGLSEQKPADSPVQTTHPVEIKTSPEQFFSTLQVKVIAGALPPKTYTGAVLHRDEMTAMPLGPKHRCVVALLTGWTEPQLKSPDTYFQLARNRPDASTRGHATITFRGSLLEFDPVSGIAVIAYADSVNAELDVGYTFDRASNSVASQQCLRAVMRSTSMPAGPEAGNPNPAKAPRRPYTLLDLDVVSTASATSPMQRPPSDDRDYSWNPILGSKPASLAGFVSETDGRMAEVVSLQKFNLQTNQRQFTPKTIVFGTPIQTTIGFAVSVEPTLAKDETPRFQMVLDLQPPGTFPKLAEIKEPFVPTAKSQVIGLSGYGANGMHRSEFQTPDEDGTYVFLARLGYPAIKVVPDALTYSRPFIIQVERKNKKSKASMEGLEPVDDPYAVPSGAVTDFILESPAKSVQEIAGGHELLFQLEGPPHWKRFSVERKEWLPLPVGNLANCEITGNRNALFILDKSGFEVRKFALGDMRLLQTAKLPTGQTYLTIRSGPLTERTPVHVMDSRGSLSLDPNTLERVSFPIFREDSSARHLDENERVVSTGDGLSVGKYPGRQLDQLVRAERLACYSGDIQGLISGNRTRTAGLWGCAGVSPAYFIEYGNFALGFGLTEGGEPMYAQVSRDQGERGNQLWLVPSAPVVIRMLERMDGVPSVPTRLVCRGYFDPTPFASTSVDDITLTKQGGWEHNAIPFHVTFDPQSMRLGVVSPDAKRFQIRQLYPVKRPGLPVLVNWPDPLVRRGGSLEFKPVVLNGTRWTAELVGGGSSTTMRVSEQGLILSVAADEPSMLMLVLLKLNGPGGESTYRIPIHLSGHTSPIAASVDIPAERLRKLERSFAARALPADPVKGLNAFFHLSSSQVKSVLGPISGHLAFVTNDPRVDIYSLKDRKVVHSFHSTAKAAYYAAADSLFEYDSNSQTLTRIAMPTGQRMQSQSMPNGATLVAFSCGMAKDSPLIAIVELRGNVQKQELIWGTLTTWESGRLMMVLNSETLRAEGVTQPKIAPWVENKPGNINDATFFISGHDGFPTQLPSSRAGTIAFMPKGFIAAFQNFGIVSPYPNARPGYYITFGFNQMQGSLYGAHFSENGTLYRFGAKSEVPSNRSQAWLSSCARYRFRQLHKNDDGQMGIEVQSAENEMPLFSVTGLVTVEGPSEPFTGQPFQFLGDSGPLLVRSAAGRVLEFVELDIPKIAAALSPRLFYVTSQPQPLVMEGKTWEYQIQTNNPAIVEGYGLRTTPTGASISPTGLVRFSAPGVVTQATRVDLAVEIKGKDNTKVLHEFPIIVLPTNVPVPGQPKRPASVPGEKF